MYAAILVSMLGFGHAVWLLKPQTLDISDPTAKAIETAVARSIADQLDEKIRKGSLPVSATDSRAYDSTGLSITVVASVTRAGR